MNPFLTSIDSLRLGTLVPPLVTISCRNDDRNGITGRTSDLFHSTRDGRGNLVSTNTSDPGLLINRKK
jgi:hypothetical protein